MADAQSTERGARVRFPPPLVFVLSIGAGVALRYVVAPPPLPFARVVQLAVGAVVAIAALALGGSAFGLFKKSGQNPRPWTPKTTLVAQGPYRFTRNPMYVSMMGLQVAIGLLAGNLWIVVLAALSLVVVHYIAVLPEEAYLDATFGDSYRDFKRKVRRYL